MLGYRQEELIGRFWADFVEDEWLDQGYEAWEMRRSGRSGRYQIKLKKKDGSDLWAAISGTPLLDGENEYAGTLAAFNDITEQKLAQEELGRSEQKARALVKELEEADQNKNQFLSVLSHELRNRWPPFPRESRCLARTGSPPNRKNTRDHSPPDRPVMQTGG